MYPYNIDNKLRFQITIQMIITSNYQISIYPQTIFNVCFKHRDWRTKP